MIFILLLTQTSDKFDQLADLLFAQRIPPRRHYGRAPDALTSSLDDLQKDLIGILCHHLAISKIRRLWLKEKKLKTSSESLAIDWQLVKSAGFGSSPLRARTVSLSANTMAHRAQFLEKDRGLFCGQKPRRNREAPKQDRKREKDSQSPRYFSP